MTAIVMGETQKLGPGQQPKINFDTKKICENLVACVAVFVAVAVVVADVEQQKGEVVKEGTCSKHGDGIGNRIRMGIVKIKRGEVTVVTVVMGMAAAVIARRDVRT